MDHGDDDLADRIADKIEQINDLALEAARRGEVAEEKRKGLEIESVESIRLFRQASGYLLRVLDLRSHFESELRAENHHKGRVLGHIGDYNQLLGELQNNPTFETTVAPFEKVSYSNKKGGTIVTIDDQSVRMDGTISGSRHGMGKSSVEYPSIPDFVAPRMIRKTEQLENALIGRCMSGK